LVRAPEIDPGAGWDRALKPGAVVGRFELVREVGRGSFGIVYEARDRDLGRTVAFKAIHPGARPEVAGDLLLREAEAAALCAHPNIVTLHDLGRSEHGPYLVLEFLRGETLAARLARGPLGVAEALRVGVEVAGGLAHAHAHGVIHRDLSPRNVFLCEDGQVKILDLGMAHAFGRRRVQGGTPGHMAPEQLRGAPEDERTDVYALGVLLHEMLTNEVPSPRSGAIEVPALPALGAIIARAQAEDPVKRPRDAGELLVALSGLQRELEHLPPNILDIAVRRRRLTRVRAAAVIAIGLVAVLGTSVAIVLFGRATPTASPNTRVAVLPFANLSGDPSQEYLGDGISQEIAGKLSTAVPVVGGSSVERYKHANPGAQAIGRELGVAFIVEGSIRRAAQRIRVNATVVRTADSRQMWSDEIDIPFDQVLEMQDRVAWRVVQALGIPLGQLRSLRGSGTRSAEAYDEYLQGEFADHVSDDRANQQDARQHYERALALDPNYAAALARLAEVEVQNYRDFIGGPEHLDRAERLLQRALSLDPQLGIARDAHAYLRGSRFDYEGAAAEYAELARDEPLNGAAWDGVCWALGYAWPRRLAEAERSCRRALELSPHNGNVYFHLVRSLALQGKRAEAREAQQHVEQLNAGTDVVPYGRFVIAMEEGRPRDALAAVPKSRGTLFTAWQAAALAQAGQIEEAFGRLEEALRAGYRDAADLRNSPWYEPLRKDPRFEKLLAKHRL
jgi:serine/threonine protein kinase/Flp pilus assembly protein TadD